MLDHFKYRDEEIRIGKKKKIDIFKIKTLSQKKVTMTATWPYKKKTAKTYLQH